MKRINPNILLIMAMIALIGLSQQSCTDELEVNREVEVRFTTMLCPNDGGRAYGDASNVNSLIVGVFTESAGGYCEVYRQEVSINGREIDVRLALAQNQTYSFVFWAYDKSRDWYDLRDLTAISMKERSAELTFEQSESIDAFCAVKEGVTITTTNNYDIVMKRPLAQVNVGTTAGAVPASLTIKSAPVTYLPFEKQVAGADDLTWTFTETSTETFSSSGQTYNYLSMGYVFAPNEEIKLNAEITLIGEHESRTIEVPNLVIEANNRSCIVGDIEIE